MEKKKSRLTRMLAVLLAIMLVTYNMPLAMLSNVFAQTEDEQNVFTLQLVDQGVPVSDIDVHMNDHLDEQIANSTTNSEGLVTFPELTHYPMDGTKNFRFFVALPDGEKSFELELEQGTTDYYIYDVRTEKLEKYEPIEEEVPGNYRVTVTQAGHGTVKINGVEYSDALQFEEGTDVKIHMKPDANFTIKSVTIAGEERTVSDEKKYQETIASLSADTTIEVEFALKTHTITFNSNGNGEIYDEANQIIHSDEGKVEVNHGSSPYFFVTPGAGYHVKRIKVDGVEEDLSKLDQEDNRFIYRFADVTTNHKVEITFAINTYTVTTEVVGGNGTISPSSKNVEYHEDLQLEITPNDLYQIKAIKINDKEVDLEEANLVWNEESDFFVYTLEKIKADLKVQVEFEKLPIEVAEWSQYLAVDPKEAISSFRHTDGSYVYVYSNNERVILAPNKDSEYNLRLKLPGYFWSLRHVISENKTIEKFQVGRLLRSKEITLKDPLVVVFDTEAPTVEGITLQGKNESIVDGTAWFSGNVTVSGVIDNKEQTFGDISYSTDIKEVYYSKGDNPAAEVYAADYDATTNSFTFEAADEDYSGMYHVWAVDMAGNKSAVKKININIDKTNPELVDGEAVTFTMKDRNFVSKALHFLSFGTFFNQAIEITVEVEDAASGIQSVSLHAKDDKDDVTVLPQDRIEIDGKKATAIFTLDAPAFTGAFEIAVKDNVGNEDTFRATKNNSNIAADNNGVVMIEQHDPTVSLLIHHQEDDIPYENIYGDVLEFEVKAQDEESGIYQVLVDVNGFLFTPELPFTAEQIYDVTYTLTTDDEKVKIQDDGSYVISVEVIDHAGNTSTVSETVFIDQSAPVITKYSFAIEKEDGEFVEAEYSEELTDSVELTDYGFFFKDKTRVTVTAEDVKRNNEASSGVKSLVVYLKDHENGKFYAVLADGSYHEIAESEIDSILPVATTSELAFDIPEAFKGQIFAKATDNVLHTGAFKTAAGTIVENLEQHEKETHIVLDIPETLYKDSNGVKLYGGNVEVDLTVVDTYSGIESIEWSVIAPYDRENNQFGRITLDVDTNYEAEQVTSIDGWELTSTELNLVKEMKTTIPVTNNSNDIMVAVKMTDRAGNVSEDEMKLSIDKTLPTLNVEYDNQASDEDYPNVYDANRTATITITERNFAAEDVIILVNEEQLALEWKSEENVEYPDLSTHTAIVQYVEDGDYTFDISYQDLAGNPANSYTQDIFTIDKTMPVIHVSYDNNSAVNENFYKATRTATITVTERNFDPNRVEVIGTAAIGKNVEFPPLGDWETNGDVHTAQIVYAEDALYSFDIAVTDKAGNAAADYEEELFYVDTTVPNLIEGEAVTLEQTNTSFFARAINFLSFGTFFNKEVQVTVKGMDNVAGIQSIALRTSDKDVVPQLVKNSFTQGELNLTAEAKFTINAASFTGNVYVELTDYSSNTGEYVVTAENSNIVAENNGIIEIEQTKPTADIHVIPNKGVTSNGKNVYSGPVTYEVVVSDADSGINTVKIDVNGKEYLHDYSTSKERQIKPIKHAINLATEDIQVNKDGSYHVSVYVIDNAGNSSKKAITTYKDETSPIITDYIFATKDSSGSYKKVKETEKFKDTVELTDYGFYFKKQTQVTVKAEDPEVDNEFTSGVKSLVVYLKDHDNGKYYAALANGSVKQIAESEINKIKPIPTKNQITFNVPVNFKGQIFAKAMDHVQNTTAFEAPDGTIVESAEQHAKETHIELDAPATATKDNNELDLYANDVDVKLTVTDTYSGIAKIDWSVVAPHDTANNQSGSLTIANDKTYAKGSHIEGWKQTKTQKNLVQEMTKTIRVNHDSNDIVIKVKMTDRSGHTSEDEMTFSIDKTAPTIQLTYDNNAPDADFTDYYKADRTATIVVTERNFRAEDVAYRITNTLGTTPALSSWTTRVNTADPNLTTHTATVSYTADGDYTFDMQYQDNARNAAAPIDQQKFTIDKTDPVITVSYNNNAAVNGNYYNAPRSATITIEERNFETSRIRVTGTASDNGNTTTFPELSGWTTNGDVQTATIHYAADALYTFDIEYTDMAGNVAAEYSMDEFYIDQTAPTLTITNVEDMSANNGEVIPVISYSDTNFNPNNVAITLAGANKGAVELDGSYSDVANGQVFTFKNFEEIKENDDLYTLSASVIDFAGNESKEEIRFSVNRFGSVYVFDNAVKNINGKYVQNEMDIILTETNVDSIKEDSVTVKMTHNGTPTDLKVGTDYTITKAGGEGQWTQYTYTIKKELFASDGRYTVALYSEDAAGNINENIDETKTAEISFGIDKTAPVIIPIDLASGEQYPVEKKKATVSIKDNLVLENATIYLNDQQVEYEVEGENYTFDIPSSNSKQHVKVVAVDAAGNELNIDITELLVSTNLFVRWYNNTPLFLGSIGGIAVLTTTLAGYLVFRKRKDVDDSANRNHESEEKVS